MRRLLLLVLIPAVMFAILSTARPAVAQYSGQDVVDDLFAKPGYVGLLVRPAFCLDNCAGDAIISFGVEAGYKYIGFGLRYAYKNKFHNLIPDLRGFYDIQLVRNLVLTPLVEFSPMFAFGSHSKSMELIIRPGVRIAYSPMPYMMLFLEPLLIDLGFYRKGWVDGQGSSSAWKLITRYGIGLGIQTRF